LALKEFDRQCQRHAKDQALSPKAQLPVAGAAKLHGIWGKWDFLLGKAKVYSHRREERGIEKQTKRYLVTRTYLNLIQIQVPVEISVSLG
jgi:hypothetical protein